MSVQLLQNGTSIHASQEGLLSQNSLRSMEEPQNCRSWFPPLDCTTWVLKTLMALIGYWCISQHRVWCLGLEGDLQDIIHQLNRSMPGIPNGSVYRLTGVMHTVINHVKLSHKLDMPQIFNLIFGMILNPDLNGLVIWFSLTDMSFCSHQLK